MRDYKKILRKLFLSLTIAACSLFLFACEGEGENIVDLSEDWIYNLPQYVDLTYSMFSHSDRDALKQAFSNSILTFDEANGTYLLDYGFTWADGMTEETGTFTIEDNIITLEANDGTTTAYTLEGDSLKENGNTFATFIRGN